MQRSLAHLDHEDRELVDDALPVDVIRVEACNELAVGVQRNDFAEDAIREAECSHELVGGAEGAAWH